MEEEMIYWRHPTLPGIKVEEVTEGHRYDGPAWLDASKQIYCENGKDEYREIGHYADGAPFLYGSESRISISHCPGMFCVATLAPVADADLAHYSDATALGVDVERADRSQVVKLRERFLSDAEMSAIPADDVEANVIAWTVKEACYKAALTPGLEFRSQILIERMPKVGPAVPVYDPKAFDYGGDGKGFRAEDYGKARVILPDGRELHFDLFTYRSDDYVVTLAYSPRSARFGKGVKG